ncbi:MAG: amidohydrolase family protein [Desulfurivibrionaceae bacterium]
MPVLNHAAGEWTTARPEMLLLRAPVVVPVCQPVIEDGAVLVADGRILAVGPYRDLKGSAGVLEYEGRALIPSLINAHCHLELSHLAGLGTRRHHGPITEWINRLLDLRLEKDGEGAMEAGRRALALLKDRGVGLVADIGNFSDSAAIRGEAGPRHLFFLELIGLSGQKEQEAMTTAGNSDLPCTPHAPYSSGPRLMSYLKRQAEALDRPFSIHLAESREEISFLKDGTGPFRDFLKDKSLWDESFSPPGCGAAEYLDRLGLLDDRTLCVHCVHLSDEELDLLARRRSRVCLCPSSNRQLGVGKAPLKGMLDRGIVPALGTDSLASNPRLDIWEEMALVRRDEPGTDPATVFALATRAGARACGADDLGMLAPGSAASILAVDFSGIPVQEIMEYLTSGNIADKVTWAEK